MNPNENGHPLLFTPIRLRSVVARNRIVLSSIEDITTGAETTIPFGIDENVAYSWTLKRAARNP